jgi:integrase
VLFLSKMSDYKLDWINGFACGRAWMVKLPALGTRNQYLDSLKIYCDSVQKTPQQLIDIKVLGLQNVGKDLEWGAENLLEEYLSTCKLTQTAKLKMVNVLKSFYKHNRRSLEPNVASNIKNDQPAPKKRKPTLTDLFDMEQVCHNSRDKALLWFIASTGCRIGTVNQLKWSDLKPTNNPKVPFMIEVDSKRLKGAGIGKYRGLTQITFVHNYANEKLQLYRKEAEKKGYKLTDDSPIFIAYYAEGKNRPLIEKSMNQLFENLSFDAWRDLEVKRFSPHDLREFLQSALDEKLTENFIAPIMAHKISGIAQSYSSHNAQELLVKYELCLPYLIPETISQLKAESIKQTEETQKRITYLESLLEQNKIQFTETVGSLTDRLAYLEKKTKIHKPLFNQR